jgi:hypothetical protein
MKSIDLKNSQLKTLNLHTSYEEITTKLIDPFVFRHIRDLILSGNIYVIQDDLFRYFAKIKVIYFYLDNVKVFLSNGLKWLEYLNPNVSVNLSMEIDSDFLFEHVIQLHLNEANFPFRKVYTYPDSDLCLFKDFPHQRLILFLLLTKNDQNLTCTLNWLIQYNEKFKVEYFCSKESTPCAYKNRMESILKECNIEKKLQKCLDKKKSLSATKSKTYSKFIFDPENIIYIVNWLKYIFEIYLQTLLCVISLVTNILNILVIRNKSKADFKKNFNSSMYKHIQANSVFNIVYSAIRLSSLVNICIFPRSSFCSKVYKKVLIQNFKIYIVEFVGNAVRLCTMISYICFSVSRYYLFTSTEPSKCLKKFKKLSYKVFYAIILILSFVLSLNLIFQLKIKILEPRNFWYSFDTSYPSFLYNAEYCNPNILNPNKYLKCLIFKVLNMFNNILNNVVFFFVSIFIDIGLVLFTNQNIENKRKLFGNTESHALNKAIKLKDKVNRMIIYNGLLYFVSHAPDFVMFLLMTIYNNDLSLYCIKLFSCTDLLEISQIFCLLSIGFQIFVFIRFDKNFRNSFFNLWHRLKKKKN